ncbi:MAG: hypothetical protein AB7R69_03860 [Candidatus Babeliales bacterium]
MNDVKLKVVILMLLAGVGFLGAMEEKKQAYDLSKILSLLQERPELQSILKADRPDNKYFNPGSRQRICALLPANLTPKEETRIYKRLVQTYQQ